MLQGRTQVLKGKWSGICLSIWPGTQNFGWQQAVAGHYLADMATMDSVSQFVHWAIALAWLHGLVKLLTPCLDSENQHVQVKTDASVYDRTATTLKSGKPTVEREEGFIFPCLRNGMALGRRSSVTFGKVRRNINVSACLCRVCVPM